MPITEIQSLAQLGSTVIVVILFLFYLQKKDDRNQKTYESFNTTINTYLRDHIKATNTFSKKLQEFSDATRGQSEIIKKMYVELVSKRKIIKRLQNEQ